MRSVFAHSSFVLGILLALVAWSPVRAAEPEAPAEEEAAKPDAPDDKKEGAAEESETELPAPGVTKGLEKRFYRGSRVVYRNVGSAVGMDPSAELTHNPYYAMALSFEPRFWYEDIFNVAAVFQITRELTDADDTTMRGETVPSDLLLRIAASRFFTIPDAGISFSASLDVKFPTSPISQARTMQASLGPGISIFGQWPVLEGLYIGYSFRATKYFHEYTTSEQEEALIPGCIQSTGGCGGFMHTGLRNASWVLSHTVALAMSFTEWLEFSIVAAFYTSYLYDSATVEGVSHTPLEPQDERYAALYELELAFRPMASLVIAIGATTFGPQLAPDSTYYTPFFNRNTALYLDLRLDIAGLVAQIECPER